jgi:hypothetical protein
LVVQAILSLLCTRASLLQSVIICDCKRRRDVSSSEIIWCYELYTVLVIFSLGELLTRCIRQNFSLLVSVFQMQYIYRWKEIKSENYCLFIHSNIWIILETFDFLRYYSNFLIVIWTYKWCTMCNVMKECPECKNRNACIFTVHTITVLSICTFMNCIVFIIQNNCYNYISETHLR